MRSGGVVAHFSIVVFVTDSGTTGVFGDIHMELVINRIPGKRFASQAIESRYGVVVCRNTPNNAICRVLFRKGCACGDKQKQQSETYEVSHYSLTSKFFPFFWHFSLAHTDFPGESTGPNLHLV